MSVIGLKEALAKLGISRPTLFKYTKLRLITPFYVDELRNGYTRTILYIVKDEKFENFVKQRDYKKNTAGVVEVKKGQDSWTFRDDLMGNECKTSYVLES